MLLHTPAIAFYCGLGNKHWAHHRVEPGRFVCIAPIYGKADKPNAKRTTQVWVPPDVEEVLLDSSTFSDSRKQRLSHLEALYRQIAHAYRFKYVHQVRYISIYDLLIDEKWVNGVRHKERWKAEEAEEAVRETLSAANFMRKQRKSLSGRFGRPVGIAYSAQGVNVEQYMTCAKSLVAMMERDDLFALGGWCVTGLMPRQILPSFYEIMGEVIPYVGSQGIKRVHIFGCVYPPALGYLLWLCDQYGIHLSTDSAGPSKKPADGEWGFGSWRDNTYKKPLILDSCRVIDQQGEKTPTCTPETRCQGQERIRHVHHTINYLAHFREREPLYYGPAPLIAQEEEPQYRQLALFP